MACVRHATRAGLWTRSSTRPETGGTAGADERNFLVSDNKAGTELGLACCHPAGRLAAGLPPEDAVEHELKGRLVIAPDGTALTALHAMPPVSAVGVQAHDETADRTAREPKSAPLPAYKFHRPQDTRVQPARGRHELLAPQLASSARRAAPGPRHADARLHARGELALRDDCVNEPCIGMRFLMRGDATTVGGLPAGLPTVTRRTALTATVENFRDPDVPTRHVSYSEVPAK